MFLAHIGAMDAFARGLKVAARIAHDGILTEFITRRYASYDSGIGARIESGQVGFRELESHALKHGEPERTSGKQELLENLVNRYLVG
jgi:xylose isomerase